VTAAPPARENRGSGLLCIVYLPEEFKRFFSRVPDGGAAEAGWEVVAAVSGFGRSSRCGRMVSRRALARVILVREGE
jgi:hypothetical protein